MSHTMGLNVRLGLSTDKVRAFTVDGTDRVVVELGDTAEISLVGDRAIVQAALEQAVEAVSALGDR